MQNARFTGFFDPRRRFFFQLAKQQDRAWFAERKANYQAAWAVPMQTLLDDVATRLLPVYREPSLKPPHLFRIYRDVRFSHDKAPFKTHVAGMIDVDVPAEGSRVQAPCALYFQVGTTVLAAAGQYVLEKKRLQRYRNALLDAREGPRVAKMVASLSRAGYEVGAATTLARAPRGVPDDHPRLHLLRLKGLVVRFPPIDAAALAQPRLVLTLVQHARRAAPLVQWLAGLAV